MRPAGFERSQTGRESPWHHVPIVSRWAARVRFMGHEATKDGTVPCVVFSFKIGQPSMSSPGSKIWLLAWVVLPGLIVVGVLPYRIDQGWMDPITGSMKRQTRFCLIPVWTTTTTSAIENWIIHHEGQYTPHWRFFYETSSALLYHANGCSLAPEIYPLRAGGLGLDDDYIQSASDEDIAEFVRIMRFGTAAEKEQAVQSACDRAFQGS